MNSLKMIEECGRHQSDTARDVADRLIARRVLELDYGEPILPADDAIFDESYPCDWLPILPAPPPRVGIRWDWVADVGMAALTLGWCWGLWALLMWVVAW